MRAGANNIMALDFGERRVGIALASGAARLAQPFTTLERSATAKNIRRLCDEQLVKTVVVGLPRGLDGQETAQTEAARQFAEELKSILDIPVCLQDEALTSRKAEAELKSRGKPYAKGDVDSLAATYILEDFLRGYVGAGNV